MKRENRLEKDIREKMSFEADSDLHDRILDDVLAAHEESVRSERSSRGPGIGRMVVESKVAMLAAAAVIVGIALLLIDHKPQEQPQNQPRTQTAKSPAELLTVVSLNAAYRQGGMEAIEEQSKKAFEMSRRPCKRIYIEELLTGFVDNRVK